MTTEHPAFTKAKSLDEPWRTHFPKSIEEVRTWQPYVIHHALDIHVLAVARTRIECAWAAYVGAVEGEDHERERDAILNYGGKLREDVAVALFPMFKDVPYAE